MPDEVIADISHCGGGAQAPPLFSFPAHVLQPKHQSGCFILRDTLHRDAQDEVPEILMVRSIAKRCVSNRGARDTHQQV
jgi:hypothetical protein